MWLARLLMEVVKTAEGAPRWVGRVARFWAPAGWGPALWPALARPDEGGRWPCLLTPDGFCRIPSSSSPKIDSSSTTRGCLDTSSGAAGVSCTFVGYDPSLVTHWAPAGQPAPRAFLEFRISHVDVGFRSPGRGGWSPAPRPSQAWCANWAPSTSFLGPRPPVTQMLFRVFPDKPWVLRGWVLVSRVPCRVLCILPQNRPSIHIHW